MSPDQKACLLALADLSRPHGEMCLHFVTVQNDTGLDRARVRRSIRALARKGFAEYYRGLWTDDGRPAGAGYCITKDGLAAAKELESPSEQSPLARRAT